MTATSGRHLPAPSDRRVFRLFNDHVRSVQRDWPVSVYDLVCECSNARCLRVLTLERAIYDRIIGDTTHYVVLPGHQQTAVERVVDVQPTHVVVQPHKTTDHTTSEPETEDRDDAT
jgi:hypothetical protein